MLTQVKDQVRDDPGDPVPVAAPLVGEARAGAWVSPTGTLYHCSHWQHEAVARRLRHAGDGPPAKWTIANSWVRLLSCGEVLCGVRVTRAQWAALLMVAEAAPAGSSYRQCLWDSLQRAGRMSALVVTKPQLDPAAHMAYRASQRRLGEIHPGD